MIITFAMFNFLMEFPFILLTRKSTQKARVSENLIVFRFQINYITPCAISSAYDAVTESFGLSVEHSSIPGWNQRTTMHEHVSKLQEHGVIALTSLSQTSCAHVCLRHVIEHVPCAEDWSECTTDKAMDSGCTHFTYLCAFVTGKGLRQTSCQW